MIYTFRCLACNHHAPVYRREFVPEGHVCVCPKCDSRTFVKTLQTPHFTFRGAPFSASTERD
jgi:predicted nucleic acid-binding Zn ribbon protein